MGARKKFKLSEKELKELENVEQQIENKKLLRKIQTIKLKHIGLSHENISKFFGVTYQTVTDWINIFSEKGINGLLERNYKGKFPLLSLEQLEILRKRNSEKPFETAKECMNFIEKTFGFEYHLHSVQKILKKNFTYLSKNRR